MIIHVKTPGYYWRRFRALFDDEPVQRLTHPAEKPYTPKRVVARRILSDEERVPHNDIAHGDSCTHSDVPYTESSGPK